MRSPDTRSPLLSKPTSGRSRESAFIAAEYLPDQVVKHLQSDNKSGYDDSPGNDNIEEQEVEEFAKQYFKEVPLHQFTVDGFTYEWMDGQYYKKVNEIKEEGSFGADALIKKATRNATIKCMGEDVHFATLTKD